MRGKPAVIMNLEVWQCTEGSYIHVLTNWLLWVVGKGSHTSGEVADEVNIVFREQLLTNRKEIEPLELGMPYGSVIEIESIYVDMHVRKTENPPINAETALRRSRSHPPKRMGG